MKIPIANIAAYSEDDGLKKIDDASGYYDDESGAVVIHPPYLTEHGLLKVGELFTIVLTFARSQNA